MRQQAGDEVSCVRMLIRFISTGLSTYFQEAVPPFLLSFTSPDNFPFSYPKFF